MSRRESVGGEAEFPTAAPPRVTTFYRATSFHLPGGKKVHPGSEPNTDDDDDEDESPYVVCVLCV